MINDLIEIAQTAGEKILTIYHQSAIEVTKKVDGSVLTQADMLAHQIICQSLAQRFPSIPIVSEESNEQFNYTTRKTWDYFFLVDPLDGTKEFVQRNGEFTVNIALVKKDYPIMGVIHAPDLALTYYAEKNKGAYKISSHESIRLKVCHSNDDTMRIVTSRSHVCEKTRIMLDDYMRINNNVVTVSAGSALKFGLIASGEADIYPRCSPTMEWDTAAGQIIVDEVGKTVNIINSKVMLRYNKEQLVNPGFIVS